jgi:hypothetical protein
MCTVDRLLAATLLGLLAASCAAQPSAKEEMARARTLVDQAERAGAQRFAAADLDAARDRLRLAETADRDKKGEVARHRADEAAADAELAMARAGSGQAQSAAQELQRSIATLRQEAERGTPASTPNRNQ